MTRPESELHVTLRSAGERVELASDARPLPDLVDEPGEGAWYVQVPLVDALTLDTIEAIDIGGRLEREIEAPEIADARKLVVRRR